MAPGDGLRALIIEEDPQSRHKSGPQPIYLQTIHSQAKDRIKAAILNSGYPFPFDRIIVNLAPASPE